MSSIYGENFIEIGCGALNQICDSLSAISPAVFEFLPKNPVGETEFSRFRVHLIPLDALYNSVWVSPFWLFDRFLLLQFLWCLAWFVLTKTNCTWCPIKTEHFWSWISFALSRIFRSVLLHSRVNTFGFYTKKYRINRTYRRPPFTYILCN